jgi:SAM-dependent methyltransferase
MAPEPTELHEFYEQWAAAREASPLEQEYALLADEWKWSQLLPLVRRFMPAPRSLLELGCGSGEMLALARRDLGPIDLYGIDLSSRMIEMARARLPEATLIAGDWSLLADLSLEVDLGLAVDILEHLPDPVPAARILGQRATLVAAKIPLEKRVRLGLPRRQARGVDHPAGHLHFWTLADSRALLARAGWEILAETCADPPEAIRYHPGAAAEPGLPGAEPGPPGAKPRPAAAAEPRPSAAAASALAPLRRAHHAFEVALERWTCAHHAPLHRRLFGSNHFVVARRRSA